LTKPLFNAISVREEGNGKNPDTFTRGLRCPGVRIRRRGVLLRRTRCELVAIAMVVVCSALFSGCRAETPTLSEQAREFEKSMRSSLAELSELFREPVADGDEAAVTGIIEKIFANAEREGRRLPFSGIVILDRQGVTVAGKYTKRPFTADDYSNFSHVIAALKRRKVETATLYFQDGTRMYALCAPLMAERKAVGVLVLGLPEAEAQREWGLTEKEFLAIDFNR
jgi:hypothetical protein